MANSGAVQVKLELGHRAQLRKKPTVEGFTHDWMVFVRGPEQSNIQHFVEKVVFHLHESFPKPKRAAESREVVRLTAGGESGSEPCVLRYVRCASGFCDMRALKWTRDPLSWCTTLYPWGTCHGHLARCQRRCDLVM
ncbi:Protein AF-9 [Liparis tanakae]|uniref:Protein AF-9 n=1 Tax=Liparis tanakae TaxID=230148 RepID=A0A4Z2FL25_9TELE|nr:Protein AF-9 [Liparis tanakae]